MPRRTIIPRSFIVLVFPFLIGLTVLLFLTNCTVTTESSDSTPAPLTSTPPLTEIDLPWDQPPEYRIVYFVAQGAVPTDSLMAPALLERALGVHTVHSWDDVIRLHDETPLDALIVHESAAPVVDREWLATVYRRGLVVAGFNVTGPELAELVQDPSVESLGFASDPYGAPFFVITYELQTGRSSGRGRTTHTLDTTEKFKLFVRTLVGDIEGVAHIRDRSEERTGRNFVTPTTTAGPTLTRAADLPSPTPPPTPPPTIMPANALSTSTPAATTTSSRAATATTTPAPT